MASITKTVTVALDEWTALTDVAAVATQPLIQFVGAGNIQLIVADGVVDIGEDDVGFTIFSFEGFEARLPVGKRVFAKLIELECGNAEVVVVELPAI